MYSLARLQELTVKALQNHNSQIPTPIFLKMVNYVTSNNTTSDNSSVHTLTSSKSTLLSIGLLMIPSTPTIFETSVVYIPPSKTLKSMTTYISNEKKDKGLYFLSDEEFIPSHKCKKRQIFMLQTQIGTNGGDFEKQAREESRIDDNG